MAVCLGYKMNKKVKIKFINNLIGSLSCGRGQVGITVNNPGLIVLSCYSYHLFNCLANQIKKNRWIENGCYDSLEPVLFMDKKKTQGTGTWPQSDHLCLHVRELYNRVECGICFWSDRTSQVTKGQVWF